jgi:hypothetical protein
VTIANNIFAGSYGSALRPSTTTVEHHNLWYGFSSNRPTGVGDVFTAPDPTTMRATRVPARAGHR